MAVLSLNNNVSSLQTQRTLSQTTSTLVKTYERLSSGLRISRAADDAAGLSIACGLDVDAKVIAQGLRNISDGVSLTNIAEGAVSELTNIVMRLQELAEQSANSTLGRDQRAALDAEAQSLSKEYTRIARTTEFNGIKILAGNPEGLSLQAGYGQSGVVRSSLGGKIGEGTFQSALSFGFSVESLVADINCGDLNGDGNLDLVGAHDTGMSILLGNGDGSFRTGEKIASPASRSVAIEDFNGDGVLDVAAVTSGGSVLSYAGRGDGTFENAAVVTLSAFARSLQSADVNGDGILDLVTANEGGNTSSILLGNGDGTFKTKTNVSTGALPWSVAMGDLTGDGVLDLAVANYAGNSISVLTGNGDGTFQADREFALAGWASTVALGDLNGDGALDMVSGTYQGEIDVFLGNGDGSFKARTGMTRGEAILDLVVADLNGDGVEDLAAADYLGGDVGIYIGNGDGSFRLSQNQATGQGTQALVQGDFNRDGVVDLATAQFVGCSTSILIAETKDGVSPLLEISLKTKAEAKWALELMQQKLSQLGAQRGIIGTNQSRLSTVVATLQVNRENMEAARAQITDADTASESAQLVKLRILQQGASAVLAQANNTPELALKLLSG